MKILYLMGTIVTNRVFSNTVTKAFCSRAQQLGGLRVQKTMIMHVETLTARIVIQLFGEHMIR